jgi:WbqC-like protein family
MTGDVLVAHQPAYLPWPGFFSRLLDVDRFLLLDHVQFSRGGWQQRNYLRTAAGRQLVTVPVIQSADQPISQVRICGDRWRLQHWRTISQAYRRASYYGQWSEQLEAVYAQPWERLADVNMALIELLLTAFGIRLRLLRSSQLQPSGHATPMLASLCELTGSTILRVGTGAAGTGGYLDQAVLAQAGIAVEVASYTSRPYRQAFPGFTGRLSALDLLLNCGPDARQILAEGSAIGRLAPQEAAR